MFSKDDAQIKSSQNKAKGNIHLYPSYMKDYKYLYLFIYYTDKCIHLYMSNILNVYISTCL